MGHGHKAVAHSDMVVAVRGSGRGGDERCMYEVWWDGGQLVSLVWLDMLHKAVLCFGVLAFRPKL